MPITAGCFSLQQNFAQQPADQEQHDKLHHQDRFGRPMAFAAAGAGPTAAALHSPGDCAANGEQGHGA